MKLVFTHENPALAGYIQNVLSEAGIEVILRNEFASGGLPPYNLWPEVWIVNDEDYEQARGLVDDLSGWEEGDQDPAEPDSPETDPSDTNPSNMNPSK